VVADEPWPYGLVGDEKSYARQLDGNFFADVKNGSLFLQALEEDAREKQVDADAHLKSVRLNAKNFMKGSTIVDRQAPDGNRTILLVDMRDMPARDFYEATLSVASKQTNVLDILAHLPLFGKRFRAGPQSRVWRFIQQLPFMATLLGALRAGKATAAAPLAMAVQNLVKSLDNDDKAQALPELVKGIAKKSIDTTVIIDEANLALPKDGNDAKAETAKAALAQITGNTKQSRSPPSRHQAHYHRSEVPPNDMFKMLTGHWGMGPRLACLYVATYGGSIDAVYTALGNLMNKRNQFSPLATTSVPGIGICLGQDDARERLINIALNGFSPVSNLKQDEGAQMASEENVAGIIPKMAEAPGLWPEVYRETEKEYVLVASSRHVRLKICKALLDEGYIQNSGGNLAR
ncbi:unnamed protein product, partial [Symbiodinium pilosum]